MSVYSSLAQDRGLVKSLWNQLMPGKNDPKIEMQMRQFS